MNDLIFELAYRSYKFNRDLDSEVTPEEWESVYGPRTKELEERYQVDKLLETVEGE